VIGVGWRREEREKTEERVRQQVMMFYDFGGAVLSGFLAADTEMTPM
jgi:hypothetical protein